MSVNGWTSIPAETSDETQRRPLDRCAWEQGHLGLDTGALGLLGYPLCVLPTLAMLRGPGYGWPTWIQMEYFWFFKVKILSKIVLLYGKIYAR